MITLTKRRQLVVGLLLVALMALTRFNHFGSPFTLPDASLAVFFLAGLYLAPSIWFPVFILEAGLMDRASIAGGVSDWCITAAYAFLLPAYGALWLAGRRFHRHAQLARISHRLSGLSLVRSYPRIGGRPGPEWRALLSLGAYLAAGLVAAFAISNVSFYFFSGYFDALGWGDYLRAVIGYFPRYAGYAALYTAIALGVHAVTISLPARLRSA